MPLVAVLLVVGAAACHCAWNLILKSETHRAEVSLGAIIVGVLLCFPCLPCTRSATSRSRPG